MSGQNKNQPLLKVENLKMYFPAKGKRNGERIYVKAVDDISFEVPEGETFGLVGESGCGKTTAGKAILRVLDPTGGKVIYKGQDIAGVPPSRIKPIRREMQLIFQDPYGSLDPRQSAYSILKEAVMCDHKPHTRQEIDARVDELLKLVELDSYMSDRYPHEMSGGQRQRLGIARALACDPKLIVCDEPVSALDVSIQAQVINLFAELQKKLNLTYIFVAHDLAVVRHIANRIAVMYLGHIVEVMDSAELFHNSRHPYTIALLSAVPTTDYYAEKKRTRIVLEGEVPSPLRAPKGCPFHPRCRFASEVCRQTMPPLADVGGGHQVACHRLDSVQKDS